jgi:hypothetical protein
MHPAPLVHDKAPAPRSVAETGLVLNSLLRLLLKTVYVRGLETTSQLAQELRLTMSVTNELLEETRDRELTEVLGSHGAQLHTEFRYGLTAKGRAWAADALEQSQYIGPAAVSLDDWCAQIERQRLVGESVGRDSLIEGFEGLVIPDRLVRQLGPAINSARAMLLYGAPGNGKTTVAGVLGASFHDIIHIPYALEIDGQTIKVFDPTVHHEHVPAAGGDATETLSLRAEDTDRRWVPCRRPVVITGGELTLGMLDLNFNPHSRFYEAPLHVKAIGGTFIVDDFGRQLVNPEDLLNRWITPMDRRVDYLTLNTGRTFSFPFDELIIFSTNLTPRDIMDPAFLRRISYKIEIKRPEPEEFRQIFKLVCGESGVQYDEGLVNSAMTEIRDKFDMPLGCYQPRFIVDQVLYACKYEGRPPTLNSVLLSEALENLAPIAEDIGTVDHGGKISGGPGIRDRDRSGASRLDAAGTSAEERKY